MKNMELIVEKLNGVLSAEDVTQFKADVEKLIESKSTEKAQLVIDTEKVKIEEQADKDYQEKFITESAKIEESLLEEYDAYMDELENTLVEKMDVYLDKEFISKIPEEAINKVAVNEAYASVVDGIMNVLEEGYIAPDSTGIAVIKEKDSVIVEKDSKIQELESSVEELVNENKKITITAEKAAVNLLISEKTLDCTDTEKTRVSKMFESKSFDDIFSSIDSFVSVIKESAKQKLVHEDIEPLNESVILKDGTVKPEAIYDDFTEDLNVDLSKKDEDLNESHRYDTVNQLL